MHLASNSSEISGAKVRTKTPTGERIERGIPIPARIPFGGKKGQGRPPKLDLSNLSVGDSVFLRAKTGKALSRARTNAHNAAKRCEYKITVRASEGGLRIWRTA